MSIFKCKMCGGELEINENQTVATCEYCGTQQTLPKLDDDRRANLYDRANHFRRNNDFDKAMGIYEQILTEDNTDAEAYWSLVLCRYGIEYVEDPTTHKRVPTVNRAQYTSIFDDENYKSALQYADTFQHSIYEEEAKTINEIQKGILAISQKEEPFDVFICYKESDNNGRRTPDSVLANDLYHQLTQEGFKVFFSRITLEDKLGSAYEPYIFAALNSAKVMVVLGTKPEYFNAVWVKNEWSRYLALIRQGQKKMLIPAYKDMDPYDLPEEFSHLQAQDMSKLGFMQDLIRGIKKIAQTDEPKPTVVKEMVVKETSTTGGGGNVQALLERGDMALEDYEWEKADDFFEEVLNNDAKNAQAYLGKALAQERCQTIDVFIQKRSDASQNARGETLTLLPDESYVDAAAKRWSIPNYVSEDEIRALYDCDLSYHSDVAERRQQYQNEERYWANHRQLSRAEKFAEGELAEELAREKKALFAALSNRVKKAEVDEAAAIKRVQENYIRYTQQVDAQAEALYQDGIERREADYQSFLQTAKTSCDVEELTVMADNFEVLGDYQDSKNLTEHCRKRAAEEQAKLDAEAERQRVLQEKAESDRIARNRKIGIISCTAAIAILAAAVVVTKVVIPNGKYNDAVALVEEGQYVQAAISFNSISYKDSAERCMELWNEVAEERKTLDAGGYHTVGLKSDGTAAAVGYDICGQCKVSDWTNIVAVSAGDYHTVGLKADGTVVVVGSNIYGQCKASDWTNIVAVSVGNCHTVGLKADGTVIAVGNNSGGRCDVSDWVDIVAVSAGGYHTVGLKADGTVVAVGDNGYSQCDVSDWTDIVAVSAGDYHTVGLKSDGTVTAVGYNLYGQCDVSDWTDIMAVSAGGYHTVGLKFDGTAVAVGNNSGGRCDLSGWTDIAAMSAGASHTVGLKSDGTVVAVGYNKSGQCNVTDWADIKLPK